MAGALRRYTDGVGLVRGKFMHLGFAVSPEVLVVSYFVAHTLASGFAHPVNAACQRAGFDRARVGTHHHQGSLEIEGARPYDGYCPGRSGIQLFSPQTNLSTGKLVRVAYFVSVTLRSLEVWLQGFVFHGSLGTEQQDDIAVGSSEVIEVFFIRLPFNVSYLEVHQEIVQVIGNGEFEIFALDKSLVSSHFHLVWGVCHNLGRSAHG